MSVQILFGTFSFSFVFLIIWGLDSKRGLTAAAVHIETVEQRMVRLLRTVKLMVTMMLWE